MKHLIQPIIDFFTFLSILIDEDKRSDLDGYFYRKAHKKAERMARK